MDVHLFALEQLFCFMCALCSSEMKVWLVKYELPIQSWRHQNAEDFGRPGWIVLTLDINMSSKELPQTRTLLLLLLSLLFEAQLVSLKRLDFEFKIEVKQEKIVIPDPLSCRQNGLLDDLFWLLLQN